MLGRDETTMSRNQWRVVYSSQSTGMVIFEAINIVRNQNKNESVSGMCAYLNSSYGIQT